MSADTLWDTLDDIRNTLLVMAENGVDGFACPQACLNDLDTWGTGRVAAVGSGLEIESLDDVRSDLGDCRRCGLFKTRAHIVFGVGDPDARLVFVGEGPGFDEDRQGEPFVGAAGQLLTRIIQAMALTRARVYICNIIKCRPPGNRNPLPEEIEACSPFLKRQLASIRPDIICALGKFAAQTLLGTTTPISRLRGRFFDYDGIQLMPTYHPAFLLRSPGKKRDVWADMQMIMRELERSEKERSS
ncbi:MAG: uracil-DNA glycosylase [Deltaproteobacteria bacterium]|nr:uracil-DNA glycosylase [Deltaproteobacteria bacterium]